MRAERLTEIRDNLHAQVEEAQRNQWLGDVDQLRLTIAHAERKVEELRYAATSDEVLVPASPT